MRCRKVVGDAWEIQCKQHLQNIKHINTVTLCIVHVYIHEIIRLNCLTVLTKEADFLERIDSPHLTTRSLRGHSFLLQPGANNYLFSAE